MQNAPASRQPGKTGLSSSQPVTLPQLLKLVERACRGDKALSQQLFGVFMQMRLRPTTPPNERALANTLIRILIGELNPPLDELEAEDVQPIQELLAGLQDTTG